jgi:hypothetical protein
MARFGFSTTSMGGKRFRISSHWIVSRISASVMPYSEDL